MIHERKARATPQRTAIHAELKKAKDHPTAAELYRRVRSKHPNIGFATVYKTLDLLVRQNAIVELAFGDAASQYDGNPDPHSHFLCLRCSQLDDVVAAPPSHGFEGDLEARGYRVQGFRLEFYGVCPRCQSKDA